MTRFELKFMQGRRTVVDVFDLKTNEQTLSVEVFDGQIKAYNVYGIEQKVPPSVKIRIPRFIEAMQKYHQRPLMECGHIANSTKEGKPSCGICLCYEVANEEPYLEGRMAECMECGKEKPSQKSLPLFAYRPKFPTDKYYCGCQGWD